MSKILYAEDEQNIAEPVIEILQIEGYDVDWAKDGACAVELLLKNNYDVVILDIMMPRKSGTEVLSEMRAARDYTPVIMLTAKSSSENKIDGLDAGADDYIGKPFVIKELLAHISALLRRSSTYSLSSGKVAYGNAYLSADTGELSTGGEVLILSLQEKMMLLSLIKKQHVRETVEAGFYSTCLNRKLETINASFRVELAEAEYVLQDI